MVLLVSRLFCRGKRPFALSLSILSTPSSLLDWGNDLPLFFVILRNEVTKKPRKIALIVGGDIKNNHRLTSTDTYHLLQKTTPRIYG